MLSHLPSIVVALTILLLMVTTYMVGRARSIYGITAPATTGNADFERIFRVQMNTLEAVVLFLPTLWLANLYSDPRITGGLGLAWVAGRFWYAYAYASAANKRGPAFGLSVLAGLALFATGLWGLLRVLLA
jgi:glutathione S-transferase